MVLIAILSTAVAATFPWSSSAITTQHHRFQSRHLWTHQDPSLSLHPSQLILLLRGGDAGDEKRKGKAGKKSSKTKVSVGADEVGSTEADDAKHAINEAMKEADAATALGNAIR
jgi:hypothetical protein